MSYFLRIKGQVFGPFNEQQLLDLQSKGKLTKTTAVSEDKRNWKTADEFPFLYAPTPAEERYVSENVDDTQYTISPPLPPPVTKEFFCTNCGNSVSEHAVACMSCGAKPTGHKKFCRQCAATLNPEQVICTTCGVAIKTDKIERVSEKAANFTEQVTGLFRIRAPSRQAVQYQNEPSSKETLGFFDIRFTRFITNIVIPILWVITIIVHSLIFGVVIYIAIMTARNGEPLALFLYPVAAVIVLTISLLAWRLFFETIMVFQRIETHLRGIKDKHLPEIKDKI